MHGADSILEEGGVVVGLILDDGTCSKDCLWVARVMGERVT